MRIHQNVIRVAPLPSLLPAPAAPPNISRWGSHGQSPDRSNVRRGRRGKAGKPENPNPHTRVKVRMRNWKRHQTHGIWWGISLTAVIWTVGSHASLSPNRCASCCGVVRATVSIALRGLRRGTAAARRLRCSSALGKRRALVASAEWPRLRTWLCWQTPGTVDCRQWPRRIGFAVVWCVRLTAWLSNRRVFGSLRLSWCSGSSGHHVAGMGSAVLLRRDTWPAVIVAARVRSAAA